MDEKGAGDGSGAVDEKGAGDGSGTGDEPGESSEIGESVGVVGSVAAEATRRMGPANSLGTAGSCFWGAAVVERDSVGKTRPAVALVEFSAGDRCWTEGSVNGGSSVRAELMGCVELARGAGLLVCELLVAGRDQARRTTFAVSAADGRTGTGR